MASMIAGENPSAAAAIETDTPALAPGLVARLTRRFQREPSLPRVPGACRIYAIGDIHGRADLLDRLMASILEDAKAGPEQRMLIFLGDYVDRGSDSKGVIERLLMPPKGFESRFLRGNHDQAVLDFLGDPAFYKVWKDFGAQETLLSYGVRPPLYDGDAAFLEARDAFARALPSDHRAFFEGLEPRIEAGDYCFVHAGVRPGVALERQSLDDLLWIRDEFLWSQEDFGKVVVHGHTPAESPVRRQNRIGIDTGAYATNRLTALVLEGSDVRFLQTE